MKIDEEIKRNRDLASCLLDKDQAARALQVAVWLEEVKDTYKIRRDCFLQCVLLAILSLVFCIMYTQCLFDKKEMEQNVMEVYTSALPLPPIKIR